MSHIEHITILNEIFCHFENIGHYSTGQVSTSRNYFYHFIQMPQDLSRQFLMKESSYMSYYCSCRLRGKGPRADKEEVP